MMNTDPHKELQELKPQNEFFIGIDSDGCAFDTMEIKHKECFCPNFIRYFNLQNVSKYTREAWDFVNLYSPSRGCNRFHAVLEVLEHLRLRNEVKARSATVPDADSLLAWTKKETKLGRACPGKVRCGGERPVHRHDPGLVPGSEQIHRGDGLWYSTLPVDAGVA